MAETRTYRDRAEANKIAVAKRRKKVRMMALDLKGGKCMLCGYDKLQDALEFHHLDKNTKDFGLSQGGLTRSWARVRKEVEKCVLVCANCHREIHAGKLQPSLETMK